MKKQLQKHLTEMEDVDFILLEHHIWLARQIRDTMITRGLSDKDMALIIGVSPRQMKAVKNGSYPFDFMLMSKLQTYNKEQAANDAKYRIEAESIGFSKYRDEYPIYINRLSDATKAIEKLLAELKNKNKNQS